MLECWLDQFLPRLTHECVKRAGKGVRMVTEGGRSVEFVDCTEAEAEFGGRYCPVFTQRRVCSWKDAPPH